MAEAKQAIEAVWHDTRNLALKVKQDLEAATDCFWRRDASEAQHLESTLSLPLSELQALEDALASAIGTPRPHRGGRALPCPC